MTKYTTKIGMYFDDSTPKIPSLVQERHALWVTTRLRSEPNSFFFISGETSDYLSISLYFVQSSLTKFLLKIPFSSFLTIFSKTYIL